MSEYLRPQVLEESMTSQNICWYDNHFPVVSEKEETQYLIVNGSRKEMNELNAADWLILNALFPQGPMVIE